MEQWRLPVSLLVFIRVFFPKFGVSVARLREEYTKYDKEEREAEVALSEALARLHRVRQLKQNAKERGDEVFHRGMEALDAYDGINQQGAEATSSGGPSAFETFDLGAIDLDPAILNSLGFDGSFLPASENSPSSR